MGPPTRFCGRIAESTDRDRLLEKHARIGGCCEWARLPSEWKGSKPVEARAGGNTSEVSSVLKAQARGIAEIAKALGAGRLNVYRVLGAGH
jgi:hypothetical protein